MIAGRLKYRISILRPIKTVGRFGETSSTWEEVYSGTPAERVKLNGRRVVIDGEIFADYTAVFNIRREHTVKENWRVREGDILYSVKNIIPNREKGMITLVCDKVKE